MINKEEAIELMEKNIETCMKDIGHHIELNAELGVGFLKYNIVPESELLSLDNHKFVMWKLSMLGFNVTLHDDLSAITISWF